MENDGCGLVGLLMEVRMKDSGCEYPKNKWKHIKQTSWVTIKESVH